MRLSAALPLALALLAGCARSEDATAVADRNQIAVVEQVRSPEQDDAEIALGEWRETLQEANTALEFGPAAAPPLFSLRCDARRSVFLQRHGVATPGDLPTMLVSIGSETRRLAITNVGGATPMLRAVLAPSDTLVATLAGASEAIIVRIGDSPPLVLPPGPAIGGFLDRCRSGAPARPPAAEANEAAPAEPANAAEPTPR